ncbi:MAG: L-lactate dehydrogenase [Anaerolineae bacterium]
MKIGIIGAGFVGATAAYAMVMSGIGREIVLVDLNKERAKAEADDIFHAVPFAHPINVTAGEYADLAGAKVVIMAAGVGQKPGETRLQLLERNMGVFEQVIPQIFTHAPDAILVVATNPVDIMTHVSAHIAAGMGIPSHRIIGSGTTLDTARFRILLSQHLGVDSTHIHGYVIGEHGDSEVLTWSSTFVGNIPLDEFCQMNQLTLDDATKQSIDQGTRRAAYHIIEGKGATYYGVGSALAQIVENILSNRRSIMTVCTPAADVAGVSDVTLSLPRLIGGDGVLATYPLSLNAQEEADLNKSGTIIRDAITGLGL